MSGSALSMRGVGASLFIYLVAASVIAGEPLNVGDEAKNFKLKSLKNETVKLSELTKDGPVVLLVRA